MCVGCEGLLSSSEIRAAFAAARGLNAMLSLDPPNLGPFGERLGPPCPTLRTRLQTINHQPIPHSPRLALFAVLEPAPAKWWKLPRRLCTMCYQGHSSVDDPTDKADVREPKRPRAASSLICDRSADSKPGTEPAALTSAVDATHYAANVTEMPPRDYWDFI
jgi:hypothetical protein